LTYDRWQSISTFRILKKYTMELEKKQVFIAIFLAKTNPGRTSVRRDLLLSETYFSFGIFHAR